jgi:hypothetical protein
MYAVGCEMMDRDGPVVKFRVGGGVIEVGPKSCKFSFYTRLCYFLVPCFDECIQTFLSSPMATV